MHLPGVLKSRITLAMFLLSAVLRPIWPQAAAERPRTGSGALRQEELAKIQEQLADADPNARLANMERIVESKDATKIQTALRIAFAGNDPALRALGVRAYLAAQKQLNFDILLPPALQKRYEEVQADAPKLAEMTRQFPYLEFLSGHAFRVQFVFGNYSMSSTTGTITDSSLGRNTAGTFSISGDRVSGNMRAIHPSSQIVDIMCSFDFRPGADGMLRGTLAFQNTRNLAFPRLSIVAPVF